MTEWDRAVAFEAIRERTQSPSAYLGFSPEVWICR
jgi:hypothetical protein